MSIPRFLRSLKASCDIYSESAMEKRTKMMQCNHEFQELEREAKIITTKSPRPAQHRSDAIVTARPQTKKRVASAAHTYVDACPTEFPERNYCFPSKKITGPARFYQPKASTQLDDDIYHEYESQPEYPQPSGELSGPYLAGKRELCVTSSHSLRRRPPTSEDSSCSPSFSTLPARR